MKVISVLYESASGKIGNLVAARARGAIQYFRARVIPSNPQTPEQSASRGALAASSAYWKTGLSNATRALWQGIASGSRNQGLSLFTKVNSYRARAGVPFIDTPPASFSTVFTRPAVTITGSTGVLAVTGISASDFWNEEPPAGKHGLLFIFVSPQQDPSREAQQHSYRLADITIRSNGALPITFKNVSLNPLGFATTASQRMFVRLIACDQYGGVSQEQLYDVLVA